MARACLRTADEVPDEARALDALAEQKAAWIAEREQKTLEGGTIELSYRLFDPESLAEELAEAGLEIERIGAESLLPEAQVAGSRHLRGLDARIAPHIPARFGYGLAAVVRPCATAPEGTAT